MPRDVSSSSSEDEADAPTQKSPVKKKESGKFTHKHTHTQSGTELLLGC